MTWDPSGGLGSGRSDIDTVQAPERAVGWAPVLAVLGCYLAAAGVFLPWAWSRSQMVLNFGDFGGLLDLPSGEMPVSAATASVAGWETGAGRALLVLVVLLAAAAHATVLVPRRRVLWTWLAVVFAAGILVSGVAGLAVTSENGSARAAAAQASEERQVLGPLDLGTEVARTRTSAGGGIIVAFVGCVVSAAGGVALGATIVLRREPDGGLK